MPYHMIFTRDDAASPWGPQFGDTDRAAVMQERKDTYVRQRGYGFEGDCKHKATDVRVEHFAHVPTGAEVEARTRHLNATV